MPDLGVWEIVIIAVVILILFGSKKLPDASRAVGRSLRIFKSETKGLRDDDDKGKGKDEQAEEKKQASNESPQQQLSPPRQEGEAVEGTPVSSPERAAERR